MVVGIICYKGLAAMWPTPREALLEEVRRDNPLNHNRGRSRSSGHGSACQPKIGARRDQGELRQGRVDQRLYQRVHGLVPDPRGDPGVDPRPAGRRIAELNGQSRERQWSRSVGLFFECSRSPALNIDGNT